MKKTNYDKVERSFDEGLLEIEKQHLLELTDKEGNKILPPPEIQSLVAKTLKEEISKLKKQNVAVYEKIGNTKEEVLKLIKKNSGFTLEEWTQIHNLRRKIELLKKEISQKTAQSDEQLVEAERKAHINKRHNVRSKWLPLT